MFARLIKAFIILLFFRLLINYLIIEKVLVIFLGTVAFITFSILFKIKVNLLELIGILAFALILELVFNKASYNYASPIMLAYGWYIAINVK